jgi:hypothetical protein
MPLQEAAPNRQTCALRVPNPGHEVARCKRARQSPVALRRDPTVPGGNSSTPPIYMGRG